MSYIFTLWLPILVSAAFVFIVSSIIHMVLGYHKNDYGQLPDEDKVREALQPFKLPPGEYYVPFSNDQKDMAKSEYQEKVKEGPVGIMTILKNEPPAMSKHLALWFLYSIIVSVFAGYITMVAVGMGGNYLHVFRFVGTSAFMGYGLALMQSSIWYGKCWKTTFKNMFDALIYALVTAGTFGWLWPAM